MKVKGKGIVFVFIIFLLCGCSASAVKQAESTVSKTTPTVEATSTSTALPTPTVIPSATPDPRFARQCLDVEPNEVELKDVTSGTALLFPDLVDIQSGKKYKLPAQQAKPWFYGWGNVSPDGRMYAYGEDITNDRGDTTYVIIWVVNAHANVLAKFSFNKEYLGAPRWLDNEQLMMSTKEYGPQLILNPFTGKWRDITNELPLLNTIPTPGGPWWRVEYSPDLEWVAYAYWDGAHRNEMDVPAGTIVRDVVTQKNVWQSTHGDEDAPAWSPDGSQLAVKDDGQLYLVNRSGQAKALLPDDIRHDVWAQTWSPDGKYIAFWNRYQESDSSLTLYEVETGKVRDYCIKNEYLGPLVWSLNSKELIVNQDIVAGPIFIDLQKNKAYKLQPLSISAWMYSLP